MGAPPSLPRSAEKIRCCWGSSAPLGVGGPSCFSTAVAVTGSPVPGRQRLLLCCCPGTEVLWYLPKEAAGDKALETSVLSVGFHQE